MIEIGRESGMSLATRRTSSALAGMAALLVIAWLARGLFAIQQYAVSILLASFSLWFLGRALSADINEGPGRGIASLLWNLTFACITTIITIWFLGWVASIQSDIFPSLISSRVPDLAIAAIATGLGAYAVQKFSPNPKGSAPTQPAFLVGQGNGPSTEGSKLTVKRDTVSVPIRSEGRTVGCVLLGDLSTSFTTPMGTVTASIPGPVTAVGIPFQGRTLSQDEVLKMTGKTSKQLVEETRPRARDVEVGSVKDQRGCRGIAMKVGPLIFDWDEQTRPKDRWLAKGVSESYMTTDGHGAAAKWNGSSLSLSEGSMKLTVGPDGFSYSPTEVKTTSPLHTLQVTRDKVMLDTRKFALKVSGENVILRTEEKTSTTESKALADDLRTLLTETAKKQVRDVMEGNPIDLSEMLNTTEEVLAKHE